MDLPLPPAAAEFIAPDRETKCDRNRFTLAEMEYNVRLSRSKELRDAELEAKGTPVRNGFVKILEILS